MERPDAKELVGIITDYVNTFSLNSDEFIEAMSSEHRTLQQSFTRLCLKWIEHCGSKDYRYDGRNEASHEICESLVAEFMRTSDIANVKPSEFLPTI